MASVMHGANSCRGSVLVLAVGTRLPTAPQTLVENYAEISRAGKSRRPPTNPSPARLTVLSLKDTS